MLATGGSPSRSRRRFASLSIWTSSWAAYGAREESERFRRFAYDESLARDKVNLEITWLRDDSLEDMENLPPPEVIAREIAEDLEAALVEFSAIAESLKPSEGGRL